MISPKEIFCQEAEELLVDIEETVLDLEQDPNNKGCIDRLFRSIHTIKGSGAMFGFDEISDFSHYLENVLECVRKGEIRVNNKFIDLILASRDHIRAMLSTDAEFKSAEDERSARIIKSFQAILPGNNRNEVINIDIPEQVNRESDTDDETGKQTDECLEPPLTPGKREKETGSLRILSNKLDNLINLVGELVITQARISQLLNDADDIESLDTDQIIENQELFFSKLANPVETLERLTLSLRDCALDMRMVPIGTIFGKFRRLVRDLSTELGKEIELELHGADTELDKTVIERLNDPIMHLIRNSVDHGIKTPETREHFGKKRKGKIKLTAAHYGHHVAIIIEDDGMGFDSDAIKQRAIERKLIKKNTVLNEAQVFSLVFLPGFSTARKLTTVSGRGVGLDVVKQEIDALGGTIKISSIKGRSARITLLLPLTLAIIDGLLMEVEGNYFVLPLSQIVECTEMNREFFDTAHDRNMVTVREEIIPFIRLREIFKIPPKKQGAADRHDDEHLAVVSFDSTRIGIVADRILGNIQTVIKALDKKYQAEGISGAAIMGDGSVALIIDISGLIRCAEKEEMNIQC